MEPKHTNRFKDSECSYISSSTNFRKHRVSHRMTREGSLSSSASHKHECYASVSTSQKRLGPVRAPCCVLLPFRGHLHCPLAHFVVSSSKKGQNKSEFTNWKGHWMPLGIWQWHHRSESTHSSSSNRLLDSSINPSHLVHSISFLWRQIED